MMIYPKKDGPASPPAWSRQASSARTGHNWARAAVRDGHLPSLPFGIGLRAADLADQPFLRKLDVLPVERHQFGTAEGAGEADQQQSRIAQPQEVCRQPGDHPFEIRDHDRFLLASSCSFREVAPNQGNGSTNGKVNGSAPKTSLTVVPDWVTGNAMNTMQIALNGAAEIAQRVESQAAARNYCLRFSSEDIRAIGLTMFIQPMREGGVRRQQ